MEGKEERFLSTTSFAIQLCLLRTQTPLGRKGQIIAAVCIHACKGQTLISIRSCIYGSTVWECAHAYLNVYAGELFTLIKISSHDEYFMMCLNK